MEVKISRAVLLQKVFVFVRSQDWVLLSRAISRCVGPFKELYEAIYGPLKSSITLHEALQTTIYGCKGPFK